MTHAASNSRRSREAWPDTDGPPEWATAVHSHDPPAWLRRVLVLIGGFMLLFSVGLGCLTYYVYLDHEYVAGRGRFRDAEAARMQAETTEQIRLGLCSLLDGLPAGPLLDPKRTEYGCGPGVPVDQLSPEVLGNLQQFGSVVAPPAQPLPRVKPEPGDTAQPTESSQEPSAQPAPATSTPAPSAAPTASGMPFDPVGMPLPTVPPLVDVSGLTDLVCAATGLCA